MWCVVARSQAWRGQSFGRLLWRSTINLYRPNRSFDLFARDPTWPQYQRRSAQNINDCRLQPDVRWPGIDYRFDVPIEIVEYVFCGGRTCPTESIRAGRC
jgi:hypothetical protein